MDIWNVGLQVTSMFIDYVSAAQAAGNLPNFRARAFTEVNYILFPSSYLETMARAAERCLCRKSLIWEWTYLELTLPARADVTSCKSYKQVGKIGSFLR